MNKQEIVNKINFYEKIFWRYIIFHGKKFLDRSILKFDLLFDKLKKDIYSKFSTTKNFSLIEKILNFFPKEGYYNIKGVWRYVPIIVISCILFFSFFTIYRAVSLFNQVFSNSPQKQVTPQSTYISESEWRKRVRQLQKKYNNQCIPTAALFAQVGRPDDFEEYSNFLYLYWVCTDGTIKIKTESFLFTNMDLICF